MMKDEINVGPRERIGIDRMQIALAIRNYTYEDELICSLLENAVISNCDSCNLKSICKGIEAVAEDYLLSSTKVVSSFNFQ